MLNQGSRGSRASHLVVDAGSRTRVLRLLRLGLGSEDDQRRDAGRVDARRHAHRAVDAERLQGSARGLRDGHPGAGRVAREGRQDAVGRGVRARRSARLAAARSSTGNRTRARDRDEKSMHDRGAALGGRLPGAMADDKPAKKDTVKIEAKFDVAEYKILILSATDSTGLETWLDAEPLQDPRRRRAAAAAVRRERDEVLRREGRSEEGQDGRRPRDAVADPLPLRERGLLAADPARHGELERQAGPDRQHPLEEQALRGRELQERVHPDELRRALDGEAAVRRVLRGAVRQDDRSEPGRGRHRVRVDRDARLPLRSVHRVRRVDAGHGDARRRRGRRTGSRTTSC